MKCWLRDDGWDGEDGEIVGFEGMGVGDYELAKDIFGELSLEVSTVFSLYTSLDVIC